MMNLLFSPKGRIGSAEFMRGAFVLIAMAVIVRLSSLVNFGLSMILGILALVSLWCWVVLWVKRFHDGGKSGWMSLVPIIIFLIAGYIGGEVMNNMFAADLIEEMERSAADALISGGMWEMFSSLLSASEAMAKKMAIPGAIFGAVLSGAFSYIGNKMIKHDPQENQYGLGSATGDVFN